MPAPELAVRIACAPVDAVGGATAQHVALLAAMRWAQPDGRFILRQVALQAATGLSERPISAAVRALKSAGVFTPIGADEWLISVERLPRIGGASIRNGGPSILDRSGAEAARPSEKAAPSASGAHEPADGRYRPRAARPSESEARASEKAASNAAGPKAVSPLLDVSVSSSPLDSLAAPEEEGEDARAGEGATAAAGSAAAAAGESSGAEAWQPTEAESRSLAWVNAAGLPWELPGGVDLRREWITALRHLSRKEADAVRRRMAGDTPSAFRSAMGPELTEARRARAAAIADSAAAAERAAAARQVDALVGDEEARTRGTYLEQARALLAEVLAADARRVRLAEGRAGWFRTMTSLRLGIDQGRVDAVTLAEARSTWGLVRDAALPPEPAAPPPPAPEPPRDFTEPVEADPEPAAP
jgi:hypothetical protein